MKIAFRTDASIRIGTGHVARCLNLANALQAQGHEITFICGDHPGHRKAAIEAAGYPLHLLTRDGIAPDSTYGPWLGTTKKRDAEQTIETLRDNPPDWLVVDHYALDGAWHHALREALGCRIMVIDDLANRHYDADILLDQNYDRNAHIAYQPWVAASCRLFLGPHYALLKPDFFSLTPASRDHTHPKRLFVFFGGIDATGETLRVLKMLALNHHNFAHADIVCGSGNPQREIIGEFCNKAGYTLHIDTTEMAKLIASADIGIGGGGVNTWERCFLHLPTLIITVADNQERASSACDGAGLVCYAGPYTMTDQALTEAMNAFLADEKKRRAIEEQCARHFTASGLSEILETLA